MFRLQGDFSLEAPQSLAESVEIPERFRVLQDGLNVRRGKFITDDKSPIVVSKRKDDILDLLPSTRWILPAGNHGS
jgi:hypothetical protein